MWLQHYLLMLFGQDRYISISQQCHVPPPSPLLCVFPFVSILLREPKLVTADRTALPTGTFVLVNSAGYPTVTRIRQAGLSEVTAPRGRSPKPALYRNVRELRQVLGSSAGLFQRQLLPEPADGALCFLHLCPDTAAPVCLCF